MEISCIADLHSNFPLLTEGNLLIIAGDLTATDSEEDWEKLNKWLESIDSFDRIIVVAGNHDMRLQENLFALTPLVTYLEDSSTSYEGFKIWGSPWSLTVPGINPKCTAFTGKEVDLAAKFDLIPKDTNILITHTPPYGVLDRCLNGKHAGSCCLNNRIQEINPEFHIFGHIHERAGGLLKGNTFFVNASYVDAHYRPVGKVQTISL